MVRARTGGGGYGRSVSVSASYDGEVPKVEGSDLIGSESFGQSDHCASVVPSGKSAYCSTSSDMRR